MKNRDVMQNIRVSDTFLSEIVQMPGGNLSAKIGGAIVLSMCQIEAAKGNLWSTLSDFRRANDDSEKEKKAALFLCSAFKKGNNIPPDILDYINERTFGRQKISFRFYPEVKEKIMKYPGKKWEDRLRKLLFIATFMPVDMTEIPLTKDLQIFYKVLPRYGNKWRDEFQYEINRICQKLGNIDLNVDAFCGTLGCTALRENASKTIVNDAENDTINLIDVIQKYPTELALELMAIPQNQETFDEIKGHHSCKRMNDVTAAAEFIFLSETSCRTEEDNFYKSFNVAKYACRILRLSEKIQHFDTHLGKSTPFLRTILTEHYGEKMLIFLDPPYHGARDYGVNRNNKRVGKFTDNDHKILADLMKENRSDKVNFIYFCRVNKPEIKQKIDELFDGSGFYFTDIKFWNATERIVTTVDMSGEKGFEKY